MFFLYIYNPLSVSSLLMRKFEEKSIQINKMKYVDFQAKNKTTTQKTKSVNTVVTYTSDNMIAMHYHFISVHGS